MDCAYRIADLDQEGPMCVLVMESADVYVQGAPHLVASTLYDSPGFLAIEPVAATLARNPSGMADLCFVPAHQVIAVRVPAEADWLKQYKGD